jgi:hypothetical protein
MTMRTASTRRSPCELLRKINDLCQEDNPKDNEIRKMCAECEKQVKRLARELNKHDKEVWKGWWQLNKTFKDDITRRLDDNYLQEGSLGDIGKLKKNK